jgi:hypothetical protein
MNARSAIALLAFVALALFLISATALSRPGVIERFEPSETIDGIVADDGPDDGPEDLPSGDDDNWEKPAPSGYPTLQEFGAEGQRGPLDPELPEETSPRFASRLRAQLRFALRAWGILFGIR